QQLLFHGWFFVKKLPLDAVLFLPQVSVLMHRSLTAMSAYLVDPFFLNPLAESSLVILYPPAINSIGGELSPVPASIFRLAVPIRVLSLFLVVYWKKVPP